MSDGLNIGGIYGGLSTLAATMIRKRDNNGDKLISNEESNMNQRAFDMIDLNSNEQIDRKELISYLERIRSNKTAMSLMNKIDTDKDHMLSIEELGIPEICFGRVDKNNDGQVDIRELMKAKSAVIRHLQIANDFTLEESGSINVDV